MTDSVLLSFGPFDRYPDSKVRAIVRLGLFGHRKDIEKLTKPVKVQVTVRGRVAPDTRKGRLAPAPPLAGDNARTFFAPILLGIGDVLGSEIEIECLEGRGPMGLTVLVVAHRDNEIDHTQGERAV